MTRFFSCDNIAWLLIRNKVGGSTNKYVYFKCLSLPGHVYHHRQLQVSAPVVRWALPTTNHIQYYKAHASHLRVNIYTSSRSLSTYPRHSYCAVCAVFHEKGVVYFLGYIQQRFSRLG